MKKAFTLAEVLITLGVIGIVATLTMPALIANYQKKQMVTQLQKGFSVLSQAAATASAELGEFTANDLVSDKASLVDFAETYVLPYLKTIQVCTDDVTKCGVEDYKYLNGDSYGISNGRSMAIVLADGSMLIMQVSSVGTLYNFIDINGRKGANMFGKDTFRFVYNSGGVRFSASQSPREQVLTGVDDANPQYACNTDSYGWYCGALIQMDGWEIKDDYPW